MLCFFGVKDYVPAEYYSWGQESVTPTGSWYITAPEFFEEGTWAQGLWAEPGPQTRVRPVCAEGVSSWI